MSETEEKLEQEAKSIFDCEKDILQYLVESAGSIGPSKLKQYTEKKKS